MPEWQPISTAPKDGTDILVWGPLMDRRVAAWDETRQMWDGYEGLHPAGAFTDWLPLPDPPEDIARPLPNHPEPDLPDLGSAPGA